MSSGTERTYNRQGIVSELRTVTLPQPLPKMYCKDPETRCWGHLLVECPASISHLLFYKAATPTTSLLV
jgi:hypothetical protein